VDITATQHQILDHVLPEVASLGWSWEALGNAAKAVGLEAEMPKILFLGGLPQALQMLNQTLDARMIEAVQNYKAQGAVGTFSIIDYGMGERLRFLEPHKAAMEKIARYLLSPGRLPLAMKMAAQTVDVLWYEAGDQSTDYNYYTKRGLLGYVYTTTFVYFVTRGGDTQAFMKKRFQGVAQIPKMKQWILKRFS